MKRRLPFEHRRVHDLSAWVLVVTYRAGGNEYATRLALSSEKVASRVESLLVAARCGDRRAACALYACLHEEWGLGVLVGRDLAWDAVFRYLAPLATGACEDIPGDVLGDASSQT